MGADVRVTGGGFSVSLKGADDLDKALARIVRENPKDVARALNKTAQRSSTRVRRQVAKDVGVPQRVIKDRIKWFKAYTEKLRSSVWVGTRGGITLDQVVGVSVSLSGQYRLGKVRVQAFKATMPSGHTGLYTRSPGARHRKHKDGHWTELPIEKPRLRIDETARPIILDVTREQMETFFPVELKRLVNLTASKAAIRKR